MILPLITTILLLNSSASYARNDLIFDYSDNLHSFKAEFDPPKKVERYGQQFDECRIKTIYVHEKPSGKLIQAIAHKQDDGDSFTCYKLSDINYRDANYLDNFSLVDINFDGYSDLEFGKMLYGGFKHYRIWDPKTGLFAKAQFLENIAAKANFDKIIFDEDNKLVISFAMYKDGAYFEEIFDVYQYINNQLTLIGKCGEPSFEVSKLKDGKMQVVRARGEDGCKDLSNIIKQYILPSYIVKNKVLDYSNNLHLFKVEIEAPLIDRCYVKNISVYEKQSKKFIQTISPVINDEVGFGCERLVIGVNEDVNFDGYNDISYIPSFSAGPNTSYVYWIFNPKTQQFVKDEILEGVISPEFDKKNKLIASSWRGSAVDYGTDIYRYVDNKLIKITSCEWSGSGNVSSLKVSQLKNGKMEVVKKAKGGGLLKYCDYPNLLKKHISQIN